jgi:hypothetical protein
VKTLPRRQPRTVYKVYTEEEYLAGADALTDWDAESAQWDEQLPELSVPDVWPLDRQDSPVQAQPSMRISRERRLQRLACAAALTGAVGTVGGAIGLVAMRSHTGDRQLAASNVVGPARTATAQIAPSVTHALPKLRVTSSRVRQRQPLERPVRAQRTHASRVRSAQGVPARVSRSTARVMQARVVQAQSAPAPATAPMVSPAQSAPAVAVSAAQSTPTEAQARPPAQSEFGFER